MDGDGNVLTPTNSSIVTKGKILVLRNVPFESLGLITSALSGAGLGYEYLDLYQGTGRRIDLEAFRGLIVMGGPMSANDNLPQLRQALRLIEEALASETPILGVCLGAQLLAKALGAPVYRNPVKEIGWIPVDLAEAAKHDHLFDGWSGREIVFHWHGDTFDLPSGATWLARSDACPHQAFRAENGAYGFQFHLEVTPEMIGDWLVQEANRADVNELTVSIDSGANTSRLKELAAMTFGRWCDLVKRRGISRGWN